MTSVWESACPRVEASPGRQSSGVRLQLASRAPSRASLRLSRRGKGARFTSGWARADHPYLHQSDKRGSTRTGGDPCGRVLLHPIPPENSGALLSLRPLRPGPCCQTWHQNGTRLARWGPGVGPRPSSKRPWGLVPRGPWRTSLPPRAWRAAGRARNPPRVRGAVGEIAGAYHQSLA